MNRLTYYVCCEIKQRNWVVGLIKFCGVSDELRNKPFTDTFATPFTSSEWVAQLKKINEKRQPYRKKGTWGDNGTKNEPHHVAFLQALTNRFWKRTVRKRLCYLAGNGARECVEIHLCHVTMCGPIRGLHVITWPLTRHFRPAPISAKSLLKSDN